MRLNLVFFVYLVNPHWEEIVIECLNAIKKSSIYEKSENLFISTVCDENQLSGLKKIISKNFDKFKIYETSNENNFEYLGLKAVYEISQNEDSLILYLHTKGMTSGLLSSKNNSIRKVLFKHLVTNSDEILEKLTEDQNIDILTVFPSNESFAWFNCFWIRSSYVKNFCSKPEKTENRYFWEKWIGSRHSKKKNIITYSPIIQYEKLEYGDLLNSLVNDEINKL
jgi:hypothetical protein